MSAQSNQSHPQLSEEGIIAVYKPVGLTPLQVLHLLEKHDKNLKQKKLAYAGRLDPMAEGVLLVLVGETCKERERFQKLSKVYEVTALFGVTTDTYDALGTVQKRTLNQIPDLLSKIESELPKCTGTQEQAYPPYSSARVNGKPLFYWARKGLLKTIKIPSKTVVIQKIAVSSHATISSDQLLTRIRKMISLIEGDFRQTEILEKWTEILSTAQKFDLVTFTVHCGQGAYMRSLVHELGKKIGTGAIALNIKRLQVGEYKSSDCVSV